MKKLDTAAYFEKVYDSPDPWSIDGKYSDKVRASILNHQFHGIYFDTGIDVCCGEGCFTDTIGFVKHKVGVDISAKAIERASSYFSDIEFRVDDYFKLDQLQEQFAFVSCFEALYYPESDLDREKALMNILKLGSNDSYFAFSVVTVGTTDDRRYFTKESFINLLEKHFVVEQVSPFVLRGRSTIVSRLFFSILMLFNKQFGLNCARHHTLTANDRDVYQHLFIAKKR